jgi:hypothetical protein
VAPETAAPLGSVTVPVMEAVTSCPHAHWNNPVAATKAVSNTRNEQQNAIDGLLITKPSIPRGVMLYSRTQFIVKKKMSGRRSFLVEKH